MAVELPVVHLKIRHRATGLTPPAVATQDLLAQTFVRQGVIEQAIETAALMLGSDKSRGYCLEMICADFLAGASLGDQESGSCRP